MNTLASKVEAIAGEAPERIALVDGARRMSYGALWAQSLAFADALRQRGLQSGDRVAIILPNRIEAVVAVYGTWLAGGVAVPLNAQARERDLTPWLAHCGARHVVHEATHVDAIAAVEAMPQVEFACALQAAQGITPDPATLSNLHPSPIPETPALILYTSGTTGAPKGAVLTRRNAAFDLDGLADAWEWTALDTIVHALPLFHVHGLVLGLFGALRAGGTLAWVSRFTPEALAAELRAGSSVLFAVPTMYHRLIEAAESDASVRAGLSAARLLISGSAGLPVREHRRIEALTGRGVLERYGLTETLINTAVRAASGPRPGSVGPPLRGIELSLVDDARGVIDADDDATIGEVRVRGPNVFPGYLDRPDATAKVIDAEGWFYTGDLATRAPDGAIRIVGRRATDLIKTGGFKVGAGEVEAALLEHAAVREAAVIGEPDDDLGERIVAIVALRAEGACTEGELADHVAGLLAPHKRPRAVRFVGELPRNAMGKVVKGLLRKP